MVHVCMWNVALFWGLLLFILNWQYCVLIEANIVFFIQLRNIIIFIYIMRERERERERERVIMKSCEEYNFLEWASTMVIKKLKTIILLPT